MMRCFIFTAFTFVLLSSIGAGVDSGAYVPLLELDRTYPNYGNKTGYQILKEVLDTAVYTGGNGDYVDLQYQPTDSILRGGSTHINACFAAALDALRRIPVGVRIDMKRQIEPPPELYCEVVEILQNELIVIARHRLVIDLDLGMELGVPGEDGILNDPK